MGDSLQAKFVKCPFYEKDRAGYIKCEGLNEDCNIQLQFINQAGDPNTDKKLEYLYKYCVRGYQDCKIYQMLMEKYDEQIQKH